jgi:hypothetical protein
MKVIFNFWLLIIYFHICVCCIVLVCINASGEDLRQLVWIVLIYKAIDLKPENMSKSLSPAIKPAVQLLQIQEVHPMAHSSACMQFLLFF